MDFFAAMFHLVTINILCTFGLSVEQLEAEDIYTLNNKLQLYQWESGVFRKDRDFTTVIQSSSTDKSYIPLNIQWLVKYFGPHFRKIHDFSHP